MRPALPHSSTDDIADAVTAAKAKPLTFDDIQLPAQGYAPVPAGYGGLTWSNGFDVMNPNVLLNDDGYDGSGFYKGRTSGRQIAWNEDGVPVEVSASGHFNLTSVELTAGTDRRLVVDIYAYKDGAQVAHDTVTLTDAHATLVTLNFSGVDEVDFVPGKGTPDKKFANSGTFIVFDDLSVGHVVNGKSNSSAWFDKPHTALVRHESDFGGHLAMADHHSPLQAAVHPMA